MAKPNKHAQKIIDSLKYITIATSDKSGQPWNSPVGHFLDNEHNFYWCSWKDNKHSKNIRENNKVFIVIYDSKAPAGTGEGVYVLATAHELTKLDDIKDALKHNTDPYNQDAPETFSGDYPRRVYKAVPGKFWINDEGNLDGNYIDVRKEANEDQ